MRHLSSCLAAALLLFAQAGAAAQESSTPYSRKNPITEAVKKTQDGVVTIKVTRTGASKDTIGTGVIIDGRGYIVTNRHVVGRLRNVRVRLNSGSEHVAEVIWGDPAYDLALVRIRTNQPLKFLKLAPVDDLMVGETVIAVGHPFGYTNTVSTGIISALGREINMPSGDTLSGLIQTNASINPGNSGGPLLNINGELIGINVALRDGAQGIAFAINAGTVDEVMARVLPASKVAGVNHGLLIKPKTLGETGDRQRVVVTGVEAEVKGIVKGDEILAVAGQQVSNAFDIERAMWDKHAGDKVNLKVVRQGRELNVTLVLSGSNGAGGVASANPASDHRFPAAANNSVPVVDNAQR